MVKERRRWRLRRGKKLSWQNHPKTASAGDNSASYVLLESNRFIFYYMSQFLKSAICNYANFCGHQMESEYINIYLKILYRINSPFLGCQLLDIFKI